MEIINKKLDELKPYEHNPRNNDEAVEYVAKSIKEFGFKVPIIIDKDGVIVAGHTRYKASIELGLDEVPCIVADDLNEEQIKAFRLADNKVSEQANWNLDLLNLELDDINLDMDNFGFEDVATSIESISYIDDLYTNEFAGAGNVSDNFSVTFVINKKYQNQIEDFIKLNGKEPIVQTIIKMSNKSEE